MDNKQERTLAKDAPSLTNKEILLKGWVKTRRDHGKLIFLDLWDRSGLIQMVVNAKVSLEAYETARQLRPEFVIEVLGKVNKRPENAVNKNLPTGEVEVEVLKINVLAKAQTLPFDMGQETLDLELPTLLDYRSLTLRHPKIKEIFRVQEVIIDAFRDALREKDFTEFQAPVIIPQTAEGGAEIFAVNYFGQKAYLAQSPQFYKQIMVGVYERVFTVNKTLRAEPSVTTRHLTEVTTLDAEMGFIDSWEEIMDMVEYTIQYVFERVRKDAWQSLESHEASLPKISKRIPRVKLRDAQEIIFKRTGVDHRKEPDLMPEDEREITRWAKDEHDSELVFVTHYPVSKRPFYTYEDPKDPGYTLSFDLIGRGTEWLTGGQRINDFETLIEKAKERGVDLKKSELYLQAFRFGLPPEGGFSFGSERITMHILGLSNVREASLFPRDMERIDTRFSFLDEEKKPENKK